MMGIYKQGKKAVAFLVSVALIATLSFSPLSGDAAAYAEEPGDTYETYPITGYVNYDFAWEVFRLVNIERVNAGLKPYTMDEDMMEYATLRAAEEFILNTRYHDRPNDKAPIGDQIYPNGYLSLYAENKGYGYITPEAMVNAWMASPGHKANILYVINSSYTKNLYRTGIGVVKNGDKYEWVQVFGLSEASMASKLQNRYRVFDIECNTSRHKVSAGFNAPGQNQIIIGYPYTYPIRIIFDGEAKAPVSGSYVKYTSQNPKIASISSDGTVKGVSEGETTIKAEYAGKTYLLSVTVHKDYDNKYFPAKVGKISTVKAALLKKKVKFTWKAPTSAYAISGYRVQYRKKGVSKWTIKSVPAKNRSLTLKELKKGARYQFRVQAYIVKDGYTYYGKYSNMKISPRAKK